MHTTPHHTAVAIVVAVFLSLSAMAQSRPGRPRPGPAVVTPPCLWMTSGETSIGPVTTTPMGDATFVYTIPADMNMSFLHQHLFVQASVEVTAGSVHRFSNGLRLTIGGTVQ